MGMFSSKTKIYTGVSHSYMMDNNYIPTTIRDSVLESILSKRNIADGLVEDIINGPPTLLRRAYKLSNNTDKYIFGSPKYKLTSERNVLSSFEQYLLNNIPIGSDIEYMKVDQQHTRHMLWDLLTNRFGYNYLTNIVVDSPVDSTVYILDTLPVLDGYLPDSGEEDDPNVYQLPDAETYEDWDTPASDRYNPFNINDPLNKEGVEVEISDVGDSGVRSAYAWEDSTYLFGSRVTQSEVFHSMLEPEDNYDGVYFYAKYTYNDEQFFFTYNPVSNSIWELSDLINNDGVEADGMFMPMLHLKIRGRYTNSDKDSRIYNDTVKLGNMIGVGLDSFIDSLKENGDHTYIEDAAVIFGSSLNTSDPLEKKYIYLFFDWVHSKVLTSVQGNQSFTINDTDLGFTISWSKMTKTTNIGSVGDVGSYLVDRVTYTHAKQVRRGALTKPEIFYTYAVSLKYQFSENMYYEILINNINSTYKSRGRNVVSNLTDFQDEEGFSMVIPISRTLVEKNFKFTDREYIYYKSLGTLITTYRKVKTKWYKRSWVGTFLKLAAVVVAVVSLGTAIKGSIGMYTLAMGLGASVALGVAVTLIKYYIVGLIIELGYRIVLKELGADWALGLAILAVAAGGARMLQQGKVSDKLALNLLNQASTISNVQSKLTAKELEKLQIRAKLDSEYFSNEMKKIEELIDNIRPDSILSLNTIMRMGESVDEYYARLNIAADSVTHSLRVIPNYVDIMLRLPEEDYIYANAERLQT